MEKLNFQIIPKTHSIYKHLSEQFPELIKNVSEVRYVMTSGSKPHYDKTFVWLTNTDGKESIMQIKSLLSSTKVKWNQPSNDVLPLDIQNELTKKFENISIFAPFGYSGCYTQVILKRNKSILCASISKLLSDTRCPSWDNITELYEDPHIMDEDEIKSNLMKLYSDCNRVDIIGELRNTLTRVRLYNKEGKTREDTYFQLSEEKAVKLVDYSSSKNCIDEVKEELKKRNYIYDGPYVEQLKTTEKFYFIKPNGFRYSTSLSIQKSKGMNFDNCNMDVNHFIINFLSKIVDYKKLILVTSSDNYPETQSGRLSFKCVDCGWITSVTIGYLITLYNNKKTLKCQQCESRNVTTKKFAIRLFKQFHSDLDFSEAYLKYNDDDIIDTKSDERIKVICHKKDKYGNVHGEFYTSYNLLVHEKSGCPNCRRSKRETKVRGFLIANKIRYFSELPIGNLKIDFFLPDYNIAIECQGEYHFEDTNNTGTYAENKERDLLKIELCNQSNIRLIYFDDLTKHKELYSIVIAKTLEELAHQLGNDSLLTNERDFCTEEYSEEIEKNNNELKQLAHDIYFKYGSVEECNKHKKEMNQSELIALRDAKKEKWINEFVEEKRKLQEERFLKEFLEEAKRCNYRRDDFYKVHPARTDPMTIKAYLKGYVKKYLTVGYVCVLPSGESYIFDTLSEIEKVTGIDWRDAKESVENNTMHMGLRFYHNDKAEYKNKEEVLDKILSFLEEQRNSLKRPFAMLDKNDNLLYVFKNDREIEDRGLVVRTSMRKYKNASKHLMKNMIRFEVITWEEYIKLSKYNDEELLNKTIKEYKSK